MSVFDGGSGAVRKPAFFFFLFFYSTAEGYELILTGERKTNNRGTHLHMKQQQL